MPTWSCSVWLHGDTWCHPPLSGCHPPLSVPNIHCHQTSTVPHSIKMADVVTACSVPDTGGRHGGHCGNYVAGIQTPSLSPTHSHTITPHPTITHTHTSHSCTNTLSHITFFTWILQTSPLAIFQSSLTHQYTKIGDREGEVRGAGEMGK